RKNNLDQSAVRRLAHEVSDKNLGFKAMYRELTDRGLVSWADLRSFDDAVQLKQCPYTETPQQLAMLRAMLDAGDVYPNGDIRFFRENPDVVMERIPARAHEHRWGRVNT